MRPMMLISVLLALAGCDRRPSDSSEFEQNLKQVLENRPAASGPAVALMKDGLGGPAWLATVHGYPDNLSVCQQLIEPYNTDPELSVLPGTYSCREIVVES